MGQSGRPHSEGLGATPHRDDDVWAALNESLRPLRAWWRARAAARTGVTDGGVDLAEPDGQETPEPADLDLDTVVQATSEVVTERIAEQLEAGLTKTRESLVGSLVDELGRLRGELGDRDDDLVHALDRVADSYDRVVTRLEHDRRERRMLAEAVLRLERRLSELDTPRAELPVEAPPAQRVIGGTVDPPQEPRRLGNGNGRIANALRPQAERPR